MPRNIDVLASVSCTKSEHTYMHIQSIDAEIISGQIDTGEDFGESEVFAIPKKNNLIRIFLHFALDESKQVFLVHTRRVMNVRVYLSHVVEVTVRYLLAVCRLLVFIQKNIEVEFTLKVLQTAECKALAWAIR